MFYVQALLDKLMNEVAQAAKKTGIASAAKLATMQQKRDLVSSVEYIYINYYSKNRLEDHKFEKIFCLYNAMEKCSISD